MTRLAPILATVLAAVLGLLLSPAATAVRAEQLVTALSSDLVSITSNFTGTQVVVFGTIERDAQTISRASAYDVVVTLAGPPTASVVRRKERTFGLWINADSQRLIGVPSFLAIHSTKPLGEIAGDTLRARLGLGLDMMRLRGALGDEPPRRTDFEEAYLRLMVDHRLYQQEASGVEFLSSTLFRAPVRLPANVPVGDYVATVHLFSDGALLASNTADLHIGKVGFEQWMTELAYDEGLLYGLATVLVACFTGWLGGVVFRRD